MCATWFYAGYTYRGLQQSKKMRKALDDMGIEMKEFDIISEDKEAYDKLSKEAKMKAHEKLFEHKGALKMFGKIMGFEK